MFHKNKELRISLILLGVSTAILTLISGTISFAAGGLTLLLGLIAITVHLTTEYYRYRKLQKLSIDLDILLISGTPLPIREYSEGELSILANQIQKMTLRLTESAEVIKADKVYLADSLADISPQLRTPLTAICGYLDLLEQLPESRSGYDVDVLLLYDDPADAAREVARLTAAGKTVSAQREETSPIRYRERLDLRKEAGVC